MFHSVQEHVPTPSPIPFPDLSSSLSRCLCCVSISGFITNNINVIVWLATSGSAPKKRALLTKLLRKSRATENRSRSRDRKRWLSHNRSACWPKDKLEIRCHRKWHSWHKQVGKKKNKERLELAEENPVCICPVRRMSFSPSTAVDFPFY